MNRDPMMQSDVHAYIRSDLRPVRPLAPAWVRALLAVLPWAAGELVLVWAAMGLRPDLGTMGIVFSWIVSACFLAAGYAMAILVVREGIPGGRLPDSFSLGAALAIALAQVLLAALIHAQHPYPIEEGKELQWGLVCSGAIGAFALPMLLTGIYLAKQGLLTSPRTCALFAGIASVVAAEAIWRLHCPFTSPAHFLLGHFPPYLILVVLGILILLRRPKSADPS